MTKLEKANGLDLVARILDGDRSAADFFVREHAPLMLAVARRILVEEDDAKDCVQDAFVKAWGALRGFRGEAKIWSWLHRITVNEALLKLRSRKRRREDSFDELLPRFDAAGCRVETPAHRLVATPVDELLEQREVREAVHTAIAELPEQYRTILILRDIEGFGTGEAAEMLSISTNNAKVRLHRARSALKRLLEPILTKGVDE